MRLLVIGGTYFLGRVFTILASDNHELHLVHRGTYSMKDFGVTEYFFDRHDAGAFEEIRGQSFDAVIDFCGYEPGDIELVFKHLSSEFSQYIFVSTADVYERICGNGRESVFKNEEFPLEKRVYSGPQGEYIYKKIQLEDELKRCCGETGKSYTIVRPAILYGPYNYAPRESEYVRQIVQNGQICIPADAKGAFQLVYVKDAGLMLLRLCGNERALNQEYNIAANEVIGYGEFEKILESVAEKDFAVRKLPVDRIIQNGMLLPFPATAEETQLYDGNKIIRDTGIGYTPVLEGMKKAYAAFSGVFS